MAEYISKSKGFGDAANSIPFNTYVPELEDAADIRNALELFYFGNSEDGTTLGDVSLYANMIDFDTRIDAKDTLFDGHTGAISDVHGVGAGNLVVGTGTSQTLTNKRLDLPKINENVNITATSTELNYVDGVTSPIQTQLNTIVNTTIPNSTPTGIINQYAGSGSAAPTGWLFCEGQEVLISSYTTLYNILTSNGTIFSYGANTNGSGGAGSTHFKIPNLKGRIPVGRDSSQTEFNEIGEVGGEKAVAISEAQMPGHVHQYGFGGGTSGGAYITQASPGGTFQSSTQVGGGQAHNNLQPYIVLNYIIKH
jgi:microcystin-dependent protein